MNKSVNLYRQKLNLLNAVFTPIEHENAMVDTVFKISQPDRTDLILKVFSRKEDFIRESYFLHHFADKILVPKIVNLVMPQDKADGAILMVAVQGELLKPQTITNALAWESGSHLARIHLEQAQGYGNLTVPICLSIDPRIPFMMKFEEGWEECKNHLPHNLLERCRRHFDKNIDLLLSVDGPCIIHRDFRPGNIIALDGKVQGIIDWSSARGGFAEEDFCPLECGEWPESSKTSFLAGYSSIRKVPDYKRLMPLLCLNRAIAIIGFTVKRGTWESKSSKLYQFNRRYLELLLDKEKG